MSPFCFLAKLQVGVPLEGRKTKQVFFFWFSRGQITSKYQVEVWTQIVTVLVFRFFLKKGRWPFGKFGMLFFKAKHVKLKFKYFFFLIIHFQFLLYFWIHLSLIRVFKKTHFVFFRDAWQSPQDRTPKVVPFLTFWTKILIFYFQQII